MYKLNIKKQSNKNDIYHDINKSIIMNTLPISTGLRCPHSFASMNDLEETLTRHIRLAFFVHSASVIFKSICYCTTPDLGQGKTGFDNIVSSKLKYKDIDIQISLKTHSEAKLGCIDFG